MSLSHRSDLTSKDVFLGRWDPNDAGDWRWYRHTDVYKQLFSAWMANGGRAITLRALGFSATVTDKNARAYLGLDKDAEITGAQRRLAQAAYDRDLFDWWWTTQGLDVSYKESAGKQVVLKSGVIIRPDAVFSREDQVILDRPVAIRGLTLMMTGQSGKIRKVEFGALQRGRTEYQNPDRWWRETTWFKGLLNGSATFENMNGKSWRKSWGATFLELSRTNLSILPNGFQEFVRRVAKAIGDKDNTELTVCLETWLKQVPAIFQGVAAGKGYLVSDFLKAPLNLGRDLIDFQASRIAKSDGVLTPRWATVDEDGKPKAATKDTHTLIVFGDSHSDAFHAGSMNSVWLAKLSSHMSEHQQKLFRGLNFAVSGNRTDLILLEIKSLVSEIAKIAGKTTVALAAGGNDTANDELNDGRSETRKRHQTNTLANLREAALLLASHGISVILFKAGNATLAQLEEIAEEVERRYPRARATAIDWSAGFDVANHSSDGSHLNNVGHDKLAKWIANNPAFAQLAIPPAATSAPETIATSHSTWWRSSSWFRNELLKSGWKGYWTGDRGPEADAAYAAAVTKAFAAYERNPSSKTYNDIAALFEKWLDGTIRGTQPGHTVERYYGARFVFGSTMVRLENSKEPHGKMVNADYDPAKWWRSSDWFQNELFNSGWKVYWTAKGGPGADASYAAAVSKAFSAYEKDPTWKNYNAIAALFEKWLDGTIRGTHSGHTVEHYFGARFVFGEAMVRLANSTTPFGKMLNADYTPPYKVDPATWWRSNEWFRNELFNSGWKGYWTSAGGEKADATYAAAVSEAFAAYGQSPSSDNYNELAALFEKWLDGTIRGTHSGHTVEHYFGAKFVFGDAMVRLANSTEPYRKMLNAEYHPATWWRSSTWFRNELFNSGWKGYWTGKSGPRADAGYAAAVKKAFASYENDPSWKNYSAVAALFEKWLDGTIRGTHSGHTVEHYFGARFVFGEAMVRLENSTSPFGKPPMINQAWQNRKKQILVIGDSLSDGDWDAKDAVWSRLLPARLEALGGDYEMNERATAGIATRPAHGRGGAKEALENALVERPNPEIVVIGIGVNNYSRGISLADTEADINSMVTTAQRAGAKILLLGMYLPPGLRGEKLSSADAAWLKANGIGQVGPGAWSNGLRKIYDKIAARFKGDDDFIYLRNYWDPIDGDDNELQLTELQGARDQIHPAFADQRALFENVWNSLSPLMALKKQTGAEFPRVSKFSAEEATAGDTPILRFDLSSGIPDNAKIPLKFWTRIEDAEAKEADGTIPDAAQYVNYKEIFYRYSSKEDWRRAEYSKETTEISAVKGAETIHLKFETYKQAPFSYRLIVNLGGKLYGIKVNDLPDPTYRLYIKDKYDDMERRAADVRQGDGANTCYVLAALQAAVSEVRGNKYIEDLITVNDQGNFEVKFEGYNKQVIARSEVSSDLWNSAAAAAGKTGRELWVRVLELAYLRATKSDLQKDGSPLRPLEMFTGAKATEINGGDRGTDAIRNIIKGGQLHYIVVGTKQKLDPAVGGYTSNHAYAVTGINKDGKFRLWDPINGKAIAITEDDLKKISERYFITDFDKTGIEKEEDLTGDGIPDAYARVTLLAEHKIKTPEAENTYHTWVANDEGKLYNIEKAYEDYQKKFASGDKIAHQIGANYENNQFNRIRKVKADSFDPYGYAEGATYFTIEHWQQSFDEQKPSQPVFTKLYTRAYDVKSQLRQSQSTEITMGLEFRAFLDTENLTTDELKRTRGGVVVGATKNYEMMTTWARKGQISTGNPWRLRVRFSIAGEAIAYGSGGGGGFLAGVRWKFQFQFGRIDNGVSWWFTLGAEISNAIDLSSTESSISKMVDAYIDGRKEDGKKHLAEVLNKAVSGNVYFGMNGLVQDGMKFIANKLADAVTNKEQRDRERIVEDRYLTLTTLYKGDKELESDQREQLDRVRSDRKALAKAFEMYGEKFHNFKWKVELGALWLPFKSGYKQGDGSYAGAENGGDPLDRGYEQFQAIMKWQQNVQDVMKNGSVAELKELLPAGALTIIEAVGVSKSFGDAINVAILRADDGAAQDAANGRYRELAGQLAGPARAVLLAGLMATVTDRIMTRLLESVEKIADGEFSDLRPPIMTGDMKIESMEDYGRHLARFASSFVGDALKSIFTNRDAMVSMLLFAATMCTAEAIARFLEDLERKVFGDVPDLTDEQKASVLENAKAEDYKKFGISDDMAKDLAAELSPEAVAKKYKLSSPQAVDLNRRIGQATLASAMRAAAIDANASVSLARGFSFDEVSKSMGWNEDQKNNVRGKLEVAAKRNGGGLTAIADEAFKSGLIADQRDAYDLLKGDSDVPRRTLCAIIKTPDDYDSLTKSLDEDAKDRLDARIEDARAENPLNKTIGKLADRVSSGWLAELNTSQRGVAEALYGELNKRGVITNRKDVQNISRGVASLGLERRHVPAAAEAIRSYSEALKNIAKLDAPSVVVVVLLAIPIFVALAKNDQAAAQAAAAELVAGIFTGVLLEGAVLAAAGGPAAAAFAFVLFVAGFGAERFGKEFTADPWYLTTPEASLLAPAYAYVQLSSGVSNFVSKLFKNGSKSRAIQFSVMTEQQVAYLALEGVFSASIQSGASQSGASMALTFELIKRGILSLPGLGKGTNVNGGFNFDNAVFDLSKLSNAEWAHALATYVHDRVIDDSQKNNLSEIIAATVNAFNRIEKREGLGNYSGLQMQAWFSAIGVLTNQKVRTDNSDFRNNFRSTMRDAFKKLLDEGVLSFSDGQLQLDYENSSRFAELLASALRGQSGSADANIDFRELSRAFDAINAGETHRNGGARHERLRTAIRFFTMYQQGGRRDYLTQSELVSLARDGHLRSMSGSTWIENTTKTATIFDLDIDWKGIQAGSWGNPAEVIRGLLIDAGNLSEQVRFRDVHLGDALVRLGLLPMSAWGDDAKDVAKFLIRAIDVGVDLGGFTPTSILSTLISQGVIGIPAPGQPITLNLRRLSSSQVAQSLKALSGTKDDVMGVEDLLRAFNYVLPGRRAFETVGNGRLMYVGGAQPWFRRTEDPRADLNAWLGTVVGPRFVSQGGGEWRFKSPSELAAAIGADLFNALLDSRYMQAYAESLAPVVIDLTGEGLRFESLATSGALYDSDGDGTKELVAWVGKDTAILAYDLNGDRVIERTDEIAFTGYKAGAKTDLEGLSAFDSNKNGALDSGDESWRKFGVWIDADQDGVTDAGEFRSLADIGIASISLTSDQRERRVDGVTLHGLTTYTTTTGRTGTVGDASFDVSRATLSAAEIARRRDLLAQAMAASGSDSSASTSLRASGVNATPDLNLFAAKI